MRALFCTARPSPVPAIALLVALSAPAALAAPPPPPPLTDETLVFPEDGDPSVPTNARLFVEPAAVVSMSVDGAAFVPPTWPETDPHPGFDGALIPGLLPSSAHVIELSGQTQDERRTLHIETTEGEDTEPPTVEGEIEFEQRRTLWGYDIIAIVPPSFDDSRVVKIGIFSSSPAMPVASLAQSVVGQSAADSHELRVPDVPAGEARTVHVVVLDGAGNETTSDLVEFIAGEGAGCSSAGLASGPLPFLGLGLLLARRRVRGHRARLDVAATLRPE